MATMILSTDSIQTSAPAIKYTANDETWIIDPGVLAYSQDNVSVDSHGFANSTLINFGNVFAVNPSETGVYFDADVGNAVVTNKAGAEIFGSLRGVFLDGAGSNIVNNFGAIIGASNAGDFAGSADTPPGVSAGVEFWADTTAALLNNHGYIFGDDYGVAEFSHHTGGTIDNYKTIRSDGFAGAGIYLATESNLLTHITNFAGGLIKGTGYSLDDALGQVSLINDGTMVGIIFTVDHTVIVNHGAIKGPVFLGSSLGFANDTFNGTGGTSGAIFAFGGNDHITGGNGNVQIHVQGTGNDTLTGGPGHNKFFFEFTPTPGQVEKITNFNPALDKIWLSETTDFQNIGPHGTLQAAHFHMGHPVNANPQIDYTSANGFLYYDANGNAGPQIHFATLYSHPTLTHADFFVEA